MTTTSASSRRRHAPTSTHRLHDLMIGALVDAAINACGLLEDADDWMALGGLGIIYGAVVCRLAGRRLPAWLPKPAPVLLVSVVIFCWATYMTTPAPVTFTPGPDF